jgi:TonB family protein
MGRTSWVVSVLVCVSAAAQTTMAPRVIERQEPQFSDEARRAKLQGTILLIAVVGEDGRPRDVRVIRPLGFGLDENAIDAVKQWRFEPGTRDGKPVTVKSTIEVSFRLAPDPLSWHLSRATFVAQEGVTRPVIVNAPYPGRGADRYGAVSVSFDVDTQGRPIHIRVENSTSREFEDEVIALIQEWRFQAAMRNGIPIEAHGFMDFTHGVDLPGPVPAARPRKR